MIHTIESLDIAFREASALAEYQEHPYTSVRAMEVVRFPWVGATTCSLAANMNRAIYEMVRQFDFEQS